MITCDECGHANPDDAEYCETRTCRAYLPHQSRGRSPRRAISVELAADALSVHLGEETRVELTVRNDGAVPESVALEAIGEVAATASLDPAVIDLRPGEAGPATLTLPPRSVSIGRHTVTVIARSEKSVDTVAQDTTLLVVTAPLMDTQPWPTPTPGPPTTDQPIPTPPRPPPSRKRAALVLGGLTVVALGVLGFLLVTRQRLEPVALREPEVFDPGAFGATSTSSDGENDEELPLLTDGDAHRAWRTESFSGEAVGQFAAKGGVGLVLRPSDNAEIQRLVVRSTTEGWGAQIYVRSRDTTTRTDPPFPVPVDPAAFGFRREDEDSDIDGDHEFRWDTPADEVLLWITDLGERSDCDPSVVSLPGRIGCPDDLRFVVISELDALGRTG